MKTVYALQELPKSIFLAGPTPRSKDVGSWRPEALRMLKQMKFEGNVYVPECEDWLAHEHYDNQLTWEWEALSISTVVIFWVPRDLETMPAFTTNVEFGLTVASGKAILGFPEDAPKMKYLAALGSRYNVWISHTLEETVRMAVWRAQKPYAATYGEHVERMKW